MKTQILTTAVVAGALALAGSAGAATYVDSTGDNFDGNAHMDITSVDVTNTLTDITFTINLNGSIVATDWGKYLIGISETDGVGDIGDPVANPWNRNIRMANGMEAFVGTWVNEGGGAQAWTYDGGWTMNGEAGVSITEQSTSFTLALADLGLTPGDTIEFDVYTTGGGDGDSANDALANAGQTVDDWQVPYTTAEGVSYTVVVPEPATAGLLGLAGLTLLRRKR